MNFQNLNSIEKICKSSYSINTIRKKIENALIDPCALVHETSYDDIFKCMNCVNVLLRFTNRVYTPLSLLDLDFLYTPSNEKTYMQKLLD